MKIKFNPNLDFQRARPVAINSEIRYFRTPHLLTIVRFFPTDLALGSTKTAQLGIVVAFVASRVQQILSTPSGAFVPIEANRDITKLLIRSGTRLASRVFPAAS